MKYLARSLAGVLWIPAILLLCAGTPRVAASEVSTGTLVSISQATWAESRRYEDIPEPRRLRVIAEDVAFDAWVAGKARADGMELAEQDRSLISQQQRTLEFVAARSAIAASIEISDDEVRAMAQEREWTSPLPPRWEVLYIFIDTTGAATDAKKDALRLRALSLRQRLTPGNFRELARVWSDDASSADGGYLGALTLEGLGPTFVSQIKQTPVGSIGGPYETRSGWNIFYIRSYTPPLERRLPFSKMRDMAVQVRADELAKRDQHSPEIWNRLLRDAYVTSGTLIREETSAMEDFLLARRYIRTKAGEAKPSEKQLRAIYKEKQDLLVYPPRRKAREILLASNDWTLETTREGWLKRRAVRDRARELRDRILKGEDFGELARKHSASPTGATGGELGWVQEPSSHVIDTALAPLRIKEVSPPIATDKGYLLLQLLEVQINKPMAFEEARTLCEEIWKSRQLKRLEKELRDQFIREESSR